MEGGFGQANNVFFDGVTYGVIAQSTSTWRWPYVIHNLFVSATRPDAKSAVISLTGGNEPPKILVSGGAFVGPFETNVAVGAGNVRVTNAFGHDL